MSELNSKNNNTLIKDFITWSNKTFLFSVVIGEKAWKPQTNITKYRTSVKWFIHIKNILHLIEVKVSRVLIYNEMRKVSESE